MSRRAIRNLALAVCALCCAGGAPLVAENPPGKAPPPGESAERPGPMRERVTERLRAQLAEAREREARLAKAVEMLDRGEPLDAALAGMGEELGWRAHDRSDARERGPGAGRGEPPRPESDPDRQRRMMRLLQEMHPEIHGRFARLTRESPEAGRAAISRMSARMEWLLDLEERDPEAFELRKQELIVGRAIMERLHRLRSLPEGDESDAQRDALREELAGLVDRQFALRLKSTAHDVARHERSLARMRDELAERERDRESLVAQRVEALMRGEFEHHHGSADAPPGERFGGDRPDRQRRPAGPPR